jgi:hypothetical protein
MLRNLPENLAPYKASAANRLPNPDPLTLDRAARQISGRYGVSLAHARVVAELAAAAVVRP